MKYDKDRQNFCYPEKLDSDPFVNMKHIKLKLPEPTFEYSRGLRATFPADTGLYTFHNLN